MAGVYVRSTYQSQYGGVANYHPIRVQPETLAAAVGATTNAASTSARTSPISAMVSRSQRALGLHARYITLQLPATPPTGYKPSGIVRIPALTTAFENAAIAAGVGGTITYLTVACQIVSTTDEKVR